MGQIPAGMEVSLKFRDGIDRTIIRRSPTNRPRIKNTATRILRNTV